MFGTWHKETHFFLSFASLSAANNKSPNLSGFDPCLAKAREERYVMRVTAISMIKLKINSFKKFHFWLVDLYYLCICSGTISKLWGTKNGGKKNFPVKIFKSSLDVRNKVKWSKNIFLRS